MFRNSDRCESAMVYLSVLLARRSWKYSTPCTALYLYSPVCVVGVPLKFPREDTSSIDSTNQMTRIDYQDDQYASRRVLFETVNHVQLRAGLIGHFGCGSDGQFGLRRTVGCQEDFGREDAHFGLYLLFRQAFQRIIK